MTLPIGQLINLVEPRQLFRTLPMDEIGEVATSIPVDPSMVVDGISDLRERRRHNKQKQETPITLQPLLTSDTFTPSTSTFTQTNAVAAPQLTTNS